MIRSYDSVVKLTEPKDTKYKTYLEAIRDASASGSVHYETGKDILRNYDEVRKLKNCSDNEKAKNITSGKEPRKGTPSKARKGKF